MNVIRGKKMARYLWIKDDANKQERLNFYANNPEKFIEEFLGVELYFYQKMILRLMRFDKNLKYKSYRKYGR